MRKVIGAPVMPTIKNRLLAQAVEVNKTNKLCANDSAAAEANKAFAFFLYNSGATDLERTQAAFDRRPDWRSA